MSPLPPLAHCLRQPTGDSSNVTDANLGTSLFEFQVNALRRFAPKRSGPLATSAFSLRIGFVDGKPEKLFELFTSNPMKNRNTLGLAPA